MYQPSTEVPEQTTGSIYGPFYGPGWSNRGVGLTIPERNPAHADPQWFECDLDDALEDPDEPFIDPFPTDRHRRVP